MRPSTDAEPTRLRSAGPIAAHGLLAAASAALVAVAARDSNAATFEQISLWLAATGIATGVFAVPLERLMVSHPRPPAAAILTLAAAAGITAAVIGQLAGPTTAATAAPYAFGAVLLGPRRATLVRGGHWPTYSRSVIADATTRLAAAATILAAADPAITLVVLATGTTCAWLGTHPEPPAAPQATTAQPATIQHLRQTLSHSTLATAVIYAPVLAQQIRAPELLDSTVPTAMAARSALWLSPALTALAAHHHTNRSPSSHTSFAVRLAVATTLTAAAAALITNHPPEWIPAVLASAATLLVLAAFTEQQRQVAAGTHARIQRSWLAATVVCAAASAVSAPTATGLFAAQLAAACTAAYLLRTTRRRAF
jgi:hypothetical protein